MPRTIPLCLLLLCALRVLRGEIPLSAAEPAVTEKDLPRLPALTPEQAIKSFKIRPGFRVELAAAEPQVNDPVAVAFDEDSRLWVVEMRDYSERRDERLGQIRLLEDKDADGRFETMHVFAEGLPWPTAVFPWDGGVFVGCTPDVLYMKDTDGDHKADVKRVVYTGFAEGMARLNVQGLLNSFNWGLDNRIHGSSSLNGGKLRRLDAPEQAPLELRNRNFAFNPRTLDIRLENGGGQHGYTFDDWGRPYVSHNSHHIQTFAYDLKYASNHPRAAMPPPLIDIPVDGPAAEVYRASPEEPWRVIRTRWRVGGLVPGPIEGGGRSAGYFTGATGVTLYRGDAYGPDFKGDAFIGDAGGHLVHRKKIRPDGVVVKAERAADEQKSEFLASTDTWFRPVQFANAPDGCLHVVDMYREVIEHPWSLPDSIKRHLDLNSGNDKGRIWRIVPENKRGGTGGPPVRLSQAPLTQLVGLLEHENGWHRDTAARLLFTRQDQAAVPRLEQLLAESKSPLGKLHALYALQGLGALNESHLVAAIAHENPNLRRHAIRLAEDVPVSKDLAIRLQSLATDSDAAVHYQLALSAPFLPIDRLAVLTAIAKQDHLSQWTRAAITASSADQAPALLQRLIDDVDVVGSPTGRDLLRALAAALPAQSAAEVVRTIAPKIQQLQDEPARYALAGALIDATGASATRDLAPILTAARAAAPDPGKPEPARLAAIELLARAPNSDDGRMLQGLLAAKETTAIRAAAIAALDRAPGFDLAPLLISRWPQMPPRVREAAAAALVKRQERTAALLGAIENGTIKPHEIPAAQVAALRQSRDKGTRERVDRLFAAAAARRADVIQRFTPALDLAGDPKRGRELFFARCASCHRLGDEGHALGPDLQTVKNMGREKLLTNILDPNREVAPNFTAYVVETADGDQQVGLLASESPAAVTLKMAYAQEITIPRPEIKTIRSANLSMMPEGLEADLTPQHLADLMEFILRI